MRVIRDPSDLLRAMQPVVASTAESIRAFATMFAASERALTEAARAAGVRRVASVRWTWAMVERSVGARLPREAPVADLPRIVRRLLERLARRAVERARLALLAAVAPPLEGPARRPEPRERGPAPPAILVSTLLLAPSAPPARPGASR